MWKFRKFLPTANIFRQIDLQYNSLVKKLIWRKFCKISWGENLQISTLCKENFPLIEKIFREMNSLVKTLLSRNFCHKLNCESKFPECHKFHWNIWQKYCKIKFLLKNKNAYWFHEIFFNKEWIFAFSTLWTGGEV